MTFVVGMIVVVGRDVAWSGLVGVLVEDLAGILYG
jgi:hypothetical protein